MSDFDRKKKLIKQDMIVLIILEIILECIYFSQGQFNIFPVIFIGLYIITYCLADKGNKSGGIIALIVGILMMLTIITGDIIDLLLGLFITIHAVKYLKLCE